MISHFRRLDCYILKRSNYRDADRLITIFSLQKGKLTLLAKGIRKITSKRASSLELFNHVNLLAYKTGGLDLITEVKLLKSYSSFSSNYQKTYIAYQIVELIDKLTAEKEPHPELFKLLKTALNYLNKLNHLDPAQSQAIIIRFQKKILNLLGFGNPDQDDLESLNHYIESLIERQLFTAQKMKI